MAITTCWECKKEISDTAAACPHCGASRGAAASAEPSAPAPPPAAKKSGSNWLLWVIGVPVGLFLLMLVIGANVSPQKAAQYAKERRVYAACDQMLADSALGNERRMTRQICDGAKAIARDGR